VIRELDRVEKRLAAVLGPDNDQANLWPQPLTQPLAEAKVGPIMAHVPSLGEIAIAEAPTQPSRALPPARHPLARPEPFGWGWQATKATPGFNPHYDLEHDAGPENFRAPGVVPVVVGDLPWMLTPRPEYIRNPKPDLIGQAGGAPELYQGLAVHMTEELAHYMLSPLDDAGREAMCSLYAVRIRFAYYVPLAKALAMYQLRRDQVTSHLSDEDVVTLDGVEMVDLSGRRQLIEISTVSEKVLTAINNAWDLLIAAATAAEKLHPATN
jgi:hypothetical protein